MKFCLSLFRACLAATLTFFSLLPFATQASALPNPSLIKSSHNSAVYFLSTDGKRYAFPNEHVYLSWYQNFSNVKTVSDTELASHALAGNITFHPGVVLIKTPSDPKVYAVSRYGVLRWVMNENTAQSLYGTSWNKMVRDVPETFFTNYVIGSPLASMVDYKLAEEQATSIMENFRPANFVPPVIVMTPPPVHHEPIQITVGVSNSLVTLNQRVLVFAKISPATHAMAHISLLDDQMNQIFKTCDKATECSGWYTVKTSIGPIRFHAQATDDQGVITKSTADQEPTLTILPVAQNITMSVTPDNTSAGNRVNYTSDARGYTSLKSHRVYITIPGESDVRLWKDCGQEVICASSSPFYRTTQLFSRVVVNDQVYVSPATTITVTGGVPPKPTLSAEKNNDGTTTVHLQAPQGETIGWSTIVEGKTEDDQALGICEYASCDITLQVSKSTELTGFTDVGGKLEASNSLTITP